MLGRVMWVVVGCRVCRVRRGSKSLGRNVLLPERVWQRIGYDQGRGQQPLALVKRGHRGTGISLLHRHSPVGCVLISL